MDALAELEITITAQQVALKFRDPVSAALPNEYSGAWSAPPDLGLPDEDPAAYGRALRDALLGPNQAVRDEFLRALTLTARATPPRPLRVYLRLAPELQGISWETLLNPDDDQPLLGRFPIHFFRFLAGNEPIVASSGRPRVLVFIANPGRLGRESISSGGVRLHPVDVEGERIRARQSLRPLVPTEIASVPGQKGTASLARLISALRDAAEPYDVLYLVCHGAVYADGARLWLDELDESSVDAKLLVEGLAGLDAARRPRLVVLASCQSAGQPEAEAEAAIDGRVAAAIGPSLVQDAGVSAVVAMQGSVFMRSVEAMMPAFFQELVRSGRVEQAMAAARGQMRIQAHPLIRSQWRVPVLFSRLNDRPLWPAGQLRPRVAYLSHAIQPADPEYAALAAVRRMLEDGGFDVIESTGPPAAREGWSRRLLDGLGTCDAAVLLLSGRAITEPDSAAPMEARLLCWRHWLEPDFQLIPLCVGAGCRPALGQAPWTLLCEAGALEVTWTAADELDAQLREALAPLQRIAEQPPRWRLADLQRRVATHFREMELDDVLQQTAQSLQAEFGLPLSQEAVALWWTRAVLSKGPTGLLRLYGSLANLTSPRVKEAFRGLLGPVGPAWVDIAAAAQIVYLASHAEQSPGSFYLKGIEPFDWVAYSYAARACGLAYDTFMDSPCLLVVVPAAAANDQERISQIRSTLRQRLESAEPTLWAESWSQASGAPPDDAAWFFEPAQPAAGDDPAGNDPAADEAIRRCVESRAANKRPVLLVLSGATATRQQFLSDLRQRFGPVGFFFMGKEPAPPGGGNGSSLTSDLPIREAGLAYQEWKTLSGRVSS
jgi:hypothetical protein